MSRTLVIVCLDCNVSLRVAQSSHVAEVFFAGRPEIMTALGEFLLSIYTETKSTDSTSYTTQ